MQFESAEFFELFILMKTSTSFCTEAGERIFGLTDGGELSSTTLALRNRRMPMEGCFKVGRYRVERFHINVFISKEIRVAELDDIKIFWKF
ncbi:hypothetical protein T4D_9337 [Trichinella pseudospiralis]|uniref:Uncharacterized protein n=1 Tax=Trichinella pseudospiralis TaxID=6337 RepID=A0A0V1FX33_TRIPS|nr:hypothetical protein T4D_9337 [Trichinella pseudospiralis]